MQGLKHAVIVILAVAVIAFVASLADRRKNRIPTGIKDRIRSTVKVASQNALIVHSTINQNPVVALLRLTSDNAVLDNLRATFTDPELTDITQIDVAALAEVVKTEQHKAFQRVAYFLPPQLGHDAFLQYYWPQSVYQRRPQTLPPPDAGPAFASPPAAATATPLPQQQQAAAPDTPEQGGATP